MKLLILTLLCFTSLTIYSQKQQLPEIPYNWYKGKVSPYYKLLGIRDKSAIIVTAGELPNYRNKTFKYAVYFKDGSVRMFIEDDNDVVTEVAVSDEQRLTLKEFLSGTNWLEIGKYNLAGSKDDNVITLDGTIHYYEIIQGSKEFSLSSRTTLYSIESKAPGWEDRIKFLDLINKFEDYFKM